MNIPFVPMAALRAVSLRTLALMCEFVKGASANAELATRNVAPYLACPFVVPRKIA